MNEVIWKKKLARFAPKPVLTWFDKRQQRIYLISYPKCGRTWLRIMIGKSMMEEFGLSDINPLHLSEFHHRNPVIPRIRVSHDDNPHYKTPDEIERDKREYANNKVIFLVRDPRDVVVSLFYHMTYRSQEYDGTISEFIRKERGGILSLITFYNIWAEHQDEAKAFLLVKYEDLHSHPIAEIKRIFDFIDVEVSENNIRCGVEYSRFENMRNLEKRQIFAEDGSAMKATDLGDERSFKTRRGQPGGYQEELNQCDMAYLEEAIAMKLSDFYSYTHFLEG